jgi:hypothetical protein
MPAHASRFGERTAAGAASFRCAACGEMAAVVKAVRSGQPLDMGPVLGIHANEGDGIVIDYFGGTLWKAASPGLMSDVEAIITSDSPDPVQLREADRELAPFYCPDCRLCYCHADWHPHVVFDGPFYDCTEGTCPAGHRHTIDD